MEASKFDRFYTDIKKSISSLKDEVKELKKVNQGQSHEIGLLRKEITRIKEDNFKLSQKLKVDIGKRDKAPKAEFVPAEDQSVSQGSGFTETSDGVNRLTELCVIPPPPPSDNQHPSQCVMSSDEALTKEEADMKFVNKAAQKSGFQIKNNNVGLCKTPVWIGGYDEIDVASEFMNTLSGVYTCPVNYDYEFNVYASTKDHCKLYLCSDRDKKRLDITSKMESTQGHYSWKATIEQKCEKNERVWLEGETSKSTMSLRIYFFGCMC